MVASTMYSTHHFQRILYWDLMLRFIYLEIPVSQFDSIKGEEIAVTDALHMCNNLIVFASFFIRSLMCSLLHRKCNHHKLILCNQHSVLVAYVIQ